MSDSTENLDKAQKNQKQESSFNFSDLNGKPFWIWDKRGHLRLAQETNELYHYLYCRLPVKDNVEHPIYDYEKTL
jgi:hypothetical protein